MGKVHRLKPTRADAEKAVRTLIAWAGDDPDREGLREAPVRVTRAYEEWFVGYDENPEQMLRRTFGEVAGYDEMVICATFHLNYFANTIWLRSPGLFTSGICPTGAWSKSRSLRGSWMHSLNDCRFRNA